MNPHLARRPRRDATLRTAPIVVVLLATCRPVPGASQTWTPPRDHCDLAARFPARTVLANTVVGELRFRIENHGATPATLDVDTTGSAILGLTFTDASGHPLYTIPPGLPPPGYTPRTETLAPGASREFTVGMNVFSPPLRAGNYHARVRTLGACGGDGTFVVSGTP